MILTRTPAKPAQCPPENPGLALDLNLPEDELISLNQPMLEFLNFGGTRKAAITAYLNRIGWTDETRIQEKDVTGDGVPELLFTEEGGYLHIYLCKDGQYDMQTPLTETYHSYEPYIISIKDLNRDGVDEIITMAGDDRARVVDVSEWDGSEFLNLNDYFIDDSFDQPCSFMLGPSHIRTADIDGNGTLELIFNQEIPIWSEYVEGLPWRKETRTCTWNGERFLSTHTEYAPPEYRFQAIQDGDRAALAGEYDRAIELYRQAIFNDQLDWWSFERKMYETQLATIADGGDATPPPAPDPDPYEYSYLAAYARFRIMLLHILRGYISDAKTVYNTLQDKFPSGQPGHEFAEMARLFWDEFQSSKNVGLACRKAIDYASAHPDILAYLGDYNHGWQSISYAPGDVCPFTSPP